MTAVKMGYIALDCIRCDWLTVTSFDYKFYEYWTRITRELDRTNDKAKVMQYLGFEYKLDTGTLKLLKGSQKNQQHWMVTASGQLADVVLRDVLFMFEHDIKFKCTRIDWQVTINRPKDYDSLKLFTAISERRSTTSYISSVDKEHGQLATVGVGSRSSWRYCRIYEKVLSDEFVGLRFEVEFKGKLAQSLLDDYSYDPSCISGVMLHELLRMKSKWLEAKFYIIMEANAPMKVKGKMDKESRTKEWLLSAVLPTFERIVNDHDDDGLIAELFMKVINNARGE